MTILILGASDDGHAIYMRERLAGCGADAVQIDCASFPAELTAANLESLQLAPVPIQDEIPRRITRAFGAGERMRACKIATDCLATLPLAPKTSERKAF
jgi:hypothetical protein